MNTKDSNNDLKKIMALSKNDLEKIFSELSVSEIEELLIKLKEVNSNV